MTPKITRLDAASLSRVFDRVTVDALMNIVRVTGMEMNGPTVPEVQGMSQNTEIMVGTLRDQIEAVKAVIDILGTYPDHQAPDLSRFEGFALAPPVPLAQQVEHLTTEVRQIAESVTVLTKQIQDLQLGMKP